METVSLHPTPAGISPFLSNPFPQLMQTPSGLALLELQGTINMPQEETDADEDDAAAAAAADADSSANTPIAIGRLEFPDSCLEYQEPSSTTGTYRVHLYVGQHQRLNGELKKLPRPIAVVRKRQPSVIASPSGIKEELEVAAIVRYKLVFAHRPEPVSIG